MTSEEYFQDEVAVEIPVSLNKKILPFTFLESHLYEKMHQFLGTYMSQADALYMLSEIKNDLYKGFTSFTSSQLHTLIHHCVKCNSLPHPPVLPSWNCTDPDLLILVENPIVISNFGDILFTSLKKVGFSSNRCMLTYCVRCSSKELDSSVLQNCIPYLHTEIAVVNPKLILTLGLTPFKALTGDKDSKLAEVKGAVRNWGTFSILPEVSLGSLFHSTQKGQSALDSFEASLTKAFNFLYPGA